MRHTNSRETGDTQELRVSSHTALKGPKDMKVITKKAVSLTCLA